MPNRFIKEKALRSRTLHKLTDFEERLFWRLLTVVDDYGRFDADPEVVRSSCFPLAPSKVSLASVSKCLQKLADANTVRLYRVGEVEYGEFIKFEEHQGKPRAKVSKFPDPPKDEQNHMLANASKCLQMLPSSVSESVFVSEFDISCEAPEKPEPSREVAERVLVFLNQKTGRSFRAYEGTNGKRKPTASMELVLSRLKAGATEEDMKGVIARKVRQWGGDPKMEKFLRPATLFNRTNYDQYVGEQEGGVERC